MNLGEAILARVIEGNESCTLTKAEIEKLFEKECYRILERIKNILEDYSLDDKECFERIENIVCTFEELSESCGSRHVF